MKTPSRQVAVPETIYTTASSARTPSHLNQSDRSVLATLNGPARPPSPPSLRTQLRKIKQLDTQAPNRADTLRHLLASAQMRLVESASTRGQQTSLSQVKKHCKRTASKLKNQYYFGEYARTAVIAQTYALAQLAAYEAALSESKSRKPVTLYGENGEDPIEFYSCHSVESDDSLSVFYGDVYPTEAQDTNKVTQNEAPSLKISTDDVTKVKNAINTTFSTVSLGSSLAQQAAHDALMYLLFAFENTQAKTQAKEPNQLTEPTTAPSDLNHLSWEPTEHTQGTETPASFTLKISADQPRIGKVVPTSRVPLDFALNNTVNIAVSGDGSGSITLECQGDSLFTLRLPPEQAVAQCNSYNTAARTLGAMAKTVRGLEHSSSAQVQALTFSPDGTVTLQETILPSKKWSPDFVQTAKDQVATLFQSNIPNAKSAEYFAGSAWTIACLKAPKHNAEETLDTSVQAKTENFLKIIRPLALSSDKHPGRIQWQPLAEHQSVNDYIDQIDDAWARAGDPGTVLSIKSGRVALRRPQ